VVVWNSHPLSLAATPNLVYIDGVRQKIPHKSSRPSKFQERPKTPNFDREAKAVVEHDGVPPLEPRKARHVAFVNVKSMYRKGKTGVQTVFDMGDEAGVGPHLWTVIARDGDITCAAPGSECLSTAEAGGGVEEIVDLQGGSMVPGLTSFGSPLGLVEIRLESSTNDGNVYDPLKADIPAILGGVQSVIRAIDGLAFGGRNTL
jgi:hypothetical protein